MERETLHCHEGMQTNEDLYFFCEEGTLSWKGLKLIQELGPYL
jgi:hypothetical protein